MPPSPSIDFGLPKRAIAAEREMRVAVVGGGIFGTTAAIHAARAGHTVHLVEAATRLLSAASWVNQIRLHRGYHYPRSSETAQSCSAEQASFAEDYAEAIVTDVRHLSTGVARQGSLVSAAQFVAFCRDQSLPLRPATSPELINPVLADTFEASEASIDPDILLRLVPQRLAESGVQVHLGVRAGAPTLDAFDKIIVVAYAGNGEVLKALGHAPQTYQFEVCEKPVVNLPPQFGATDIVILDGPFMSVGPMGRTGAYVLGHVTHAIHATNVGAEADVPAALRDCLDQGTIRNSELDELLKVHRSRGAIHPGARGRGAYRLDVHGPRRAAGSRRHGRTANAGDPRRRQADHDLLGQDRQLRRGRARPSP